MTLSDILGKTKTTLKANSPEILTALGLTGMVTTAYLTGKASFSAAHKLSEESPYLTLKERTRRVWKFYIPPVISGAVTAGCIVGASKANANRTTAAVTAYSLTERAFTEYKEKVVEEIGKGKEQKIRDELAQKRVTDNPPGAKEILVTGSNQVLFCELYTGRYFRSTVEALQQAKNEINASVNRGVYATLDDFYDIIGLGHTSESGHMGWESDRLMELHLSTAMSDSKEPCITFEYNYVKPLR